MGSEAAVPPSSTDLDRGLDQLIPPGYLSVIGLLMRDTGQDLANLVEWYETLHAPNAEFAWPYMARYARNYITRVEQGPRPPYRVLTEFDWKGTADQALARAAFKQPAAMAAMASEFAGTPPAWLLDIFSVLVPVTRTELGTMAPASAGGPPTPRRIMLLRRCEGAAPDAFGEAVHGLAAEILARSPGAGVAIAMCHGPRAAADEPDAVLLVDGAQAVALPQPEPGLAEIMNVFAAERRNSPVGPLAR